MKANLSPETAQAMIDKPARPSEHLMRVLERMEAAKPARSIRTEKVLERLSESKEFWEAIAKYIDDESNNDDLIADLKLEFDHANESIDCEQLEYPDYYDGEEHGG